MNTLILFRDDHDDHKRMHLSINVLEGIGYMYCYRWVDTSGEDQTTGYTSKCLLPIDEVFKTSEAVLKLAFTSTPLKVESFVLSQFIYLENGIYNLLKTKATPKTWEEFITYAANIFIQKNTDYQAQFTKDLMEEGPEVWYWEAKKKVRRLKTWIEKGSLEVKGENVLDSVTDLFNYTVMLEMFYNAKTRCNNPLRHLSKVEFIATANDRAPIQWLNYIYDNSQGKLIDYADRELRVLILNTMVGMN